MIREAVDAYLVEDKPDPDAALDEAFGSLPELELPSRDLPLDPYVLGVWLGCGIEDDAVVASGLIAAAV